uniref:HD domain-containing protein n=1 Tax=viral metagenome TaxID=1070528 RepID=A0A6C0CKZ8_9ZZZZ
MARPMIVNTSRLAFAKQDIHRLLKSYGKRDYIGEEGVSQVSHAFQTVAHTCRLMQLIPDYKQDALSTRYVIVAGWLHDIGQLKSFEENDMTRSKWGVHKHEQIGSQYLQTLGFPYPVFRLTEYHVKAKRYMVTTNAKYRDNLSTASLATLEEQGGTLSEAEASEFKSDPLFHASLLLRLADDKAKIPGDVVDFDGAFELVWKLVEGK